MADALSVSPCVFICLKKKTITSYNGNPAKPGSRQCLLFLIRKAMGVFVINILCILSKSFINYCDCFFRMSSSNASWYALANFKCSS